MLMFMDWTVGIATMLGLNAVEVPKGAGYLAKPIVFLEIDADCLPKASDWLPKPSDRMPKDVDLLPKPNVRLEIYAD